METCTSIKYSVSYTLLQINNNDFSTWVSMNMMKFHHKIQNEAICDCMLLVHNVIFCIASESPYEQYMLPELNKFIVY